MLSQKLPEEQRAPYRVIEGLLGVSLAGVLGLVWFAAQQSARVDESASDLKELMGDIRELGRDMGTLQQDFNLLRGEIKGIGRDVERNRDARLELERRVNREAFRDFRGQSRGAGEASEQPGEP